MRRGGAAIGAIASTVRSCLLGAASNLEEIAKLDSDDDMALFLLSVGGVVGAWFLTPADREFLIRLGSAGPMHVPVGAAVIAGWIATFVSAALFLWSAVFRTAHHFLPDRRLLSGALWLGGWIVASLLALAGPTLVAHALTSRPA